MNGIDAERLIVAQGSVDVATQLITTPVDGIVCNILAEVIIELIPQMSAIAKPSTWGIFQWYFSRTIKSCCGYFRKTWLASCYSMETQRMVLFKRAAFLNYRYTREQGTLNREQG